MNSLQDLISKWEADVRVGLSHQVAIQIQRVEPSKVPRQLRLPLANLCRRVGLMSHGLKVLQPIVRADRDKSEYGATDEERAEYAAFLERIGATEEAGMILDQVNTSVAPTALLFKAFCDFARWEYASALPYPNSYLACQLKPYARLVGQVNLASALIAAERNKEAEDLLNELINVTRASEYGRLLGNCLEMRAQVHIADQNFGSAKDDLSEAKNLVKSETTQDLLFVNKWTAILVAVEERRIEPLLDFRALAVKHDSWESVRESDFFLLKTKFDQERFNHLIFGTPHPAYRQKILRHLNNRELPSHFVIGKGANIFEVSTGRVNGQSGLKTGSKTQLLVDILTRDLYKPRTLGGIHAELFPGEYFNVYSSPNRVHQMVFRTRKQLLDLNLNVTLERKGDAYRLTCGEGMSLKVPLDRATGTRFDPQMRILLEVFGVQKEFTPFEARQKLGLPPASVKRLLSWAVREGRLRCYGATTSLTYEIINSSRSVAEPAPQSETLDAKT